MGDNGDTIRVWSLDNGSEQYSFNKHASAVTPIAVSPKGHTVASASVDGTILLWGINSERVVANPRKLNIAATAVAFSPDGQWLVLAGWDREIRVVWAAGIPRSPSAPSTFLFPKIGKSFRHFAPEESIVPTIEFTPDGEHLVLSHIGLPVGVWN